MDVDQLYALIDDPENRQQISCLEFTEALLERVTSFQPTLNAFITVMAEDALETAGWVDRERANHSSLPLDGMPVAIKDNIAVANRVTTNGSRLFEHALSKSDAEVVRRLKKAGAVIIGKTHLHELAWGVTSDSAYGRCRNPWDPERIPGGSSGGSAVAVAADLCVGALGTDTGGSVRLPASLVGVFGLRPTVDAISTSGVYPLAQTFDTVGPMARWARDAALVFRSAAERPPLEPTSHGGGEPSIAGVRIGVPREYFFDEIDSDVRRPLEAALTTLADLGASVREIAIESAKRAYEIYARMVCVEALANYRAIVSESDAPVGADIKQHLAAGNAVSGVDYVEMRKFMTMWDESIRRVFDEVDVIATPASPIVAPLRDEVEHLDILGALTKTTRPWSLARLPAVSVLCGFCTSGLPVGLQLTTRAWNEDVLFEVSAAYQRVTDWHRRRPSRSVRA